MGKKQSIRNKFLRVTLSLLFIFAFVMGMVSVISVNKLSKENSRQMIQQICDKETLKFSNKLNLVENSVTMIYEYALELIEIREEESSIYSDAYSEQVRNLAISAADKTDGAMAVYFRYNPEMVGSGTSGFLWVKKSEEESFQEEPPTDILAYNADDIEHVGWYYSPKESGRPIWMSPYYNKNLNVFMISYVIPIYLPDGEFVGVIGMDIDFNSIIKSVGEEKLYKTGKVALVDMTEYLVYYPDRQGNLVKEKLSRTLYNHLTTINKADELLETTQADGSVSVICCKGLANGMKLFVSVPLKEINENRNKLILWYVVILLFVFLVTLTIISRNTRKIIQPLKRLTEITSRYSQGDWTENYISNTSDEIHELSEGIAVMAQTTQAYISRIKQMARIDELTGLKNKTCYYEAIRRLEEDGLEKRFPYAVIVMDLNSLKITNDSFGHIAGDRLIQEAGAYISRIFGKDCVFRIGGDEYVAILCGAQYENRLSLCKEFEEGMGREIQDIPGLRIAISYGMASCGEDGTEYDALFRIADRRMYVKKKQMKQEPGDQAGGDL